MTKMLLVSDSHRDDETLKNILDLYPNYTIIHGGDSCMEKDDPMLEGVHVVLGNHDFVNFDEVIYLKPDMICHGHTLGVYHTFDRMIDLAKKHECHTIIHGHTHIPYDTRIEDIRIINPGSTMINRGSYGFGTYAILDTETGELHFHHHETHEIVDDIVIPDGIQTLQSFRDLIKEFSL